MSDVPIAAQQEPGTTVTIQEPSAGSGVVRRTILPGGLRVISETVPGVRSAAFGISATTGSRDEDSEHAGSAHFLEHLLFKGTPTRDALAISAELDSVGANHNAYTTKEQTTYHAKVLDRHLPLAVDVVSDMVANSTLPEQEVETERGVILEEIAMYEDEPGDLVHDVFAAHYFGDSDLGRSELGTNESIKALPRERIWEQYQECYTPDRLVVAAAGNFDHDHLVELVGEAFAGPIAAANADTRAAAPRIGGKPAPTQTGTVVVRRETEQAHLLLGMPGVARNDDRWYAMRMLSTVLGSGMSSRLFQEVREKRGLAYSVFSFAPSFAETGVFQVYAGCLPEKADESLSVIRAELARSASDGVTDEELARAKGQIAGSWVLGAESTNARMGRLAVHELSYPHHFSLDEDLALFDEVTSQDVAQVAADLLAGPETLAVIGPFATDREF